MKIRYIRETKRSYMTVEPEGAEQQEDGVWEAGKIGRAHVGTPVT